MYMHQFYLSLVFSKDYFVHALRHTEQKGRFLRFVDWGYRAYRLHLQCTEFTYKTFEPEQNL